MSLERRTPPRRTTELARTAWRRKPRRLSPEQRRVRAQVLARDGDCVLRSDIGAGECLGKLEVHHLVKAWKKPPYEPWLLVTLCSRHNTWVEDHPLVGRVMGLVVREGDSIAVAWQRMHQRGLVTETPELPT